MRIAADLGLCFGFREAGKLVIFRDQASFAAARRQVETVRTFGVEQEIADPRRCLTIEPALRVRVGDLKGGVFTPSEQVGGCAAFWHGLAEVLVRRRSIA